jgi:tetratricopeptide (TPR) repeat protein
LIAFQEGRYADAVRLFENNLAYLNPMNSDWHYAWLIEYLGQAVLAVGDLTRAAAFFRQSLSIHFDGKAYRLVAYSLHGLANVALAEGQFRRAVRLLGAVERIYEQYPPIPSRRRQFETSLTRSHDVLDLLSFRMAWQEGQSMTLEQVVAEALEIPY